MMRPAQANAGPAARDVETLMMKRGTSSECPSRHAGSCGIAAVAILFGAVLLAGCQTVSTSPTTESEDNQLSASPSNIASLSSVIQRNQSDPQAYNMRGTVFGQAGRNEEALADFNKAIGLDPNFTQAYANRGLINRKTGRLDAAIADYDKALQYDPNDAFSLNNRGIAKRANGEVAAPTINWVTQMSFKPALIAIGVKADSGAHAIIENTKEFVLNNLGKDGKGAAFAFFKPTVLEDLIAMNALNRPGPMEFIPLYIRRKHQKEKIEYPHPLLEEILKPTYGIMVYQEQIMQAAQIIAGYSLGSADILRRAMGKKDKEKMAKEREKFVQGAEEKNKIPAAKANEIFDVMERFAEYGFNRSHSAAYAIVAFQTAYLKAHYRAEFMAAVLTNNLSNIDEITFFMDECKRMNIPVLGPDINESGMNFTVNMKGEIRFGLAAVKGVGEAAVTSLLEERNANGKIGRAHV